jgi:hypothetical protein
LSDALRNEPSMVGQLTRVSIGRYGLLSLEDALGHTSLDRPEQSAFDEQLARLERTLRLAPSVHGERAIVLSGLENMGGSEMAVYLEEGLFEMDKDGNPNTACLAHRVANWWWGSLIYRPRLMRQQADLCRAFRDFAEIVDVPGPAAQLRLEAQEGIWSQTIRTHVPACLFLPDFRGFREGGLNYRQWLVSARLGLRIAALVREHRKFPDQLDDLRDAELSEVPLGLFSARALRFEGNEVSFQIHDVDPVTSKPRGSFYVVFDELFSELTPTNFGNDAVESSGLPSSALDSG